MPEFGTSGLENNQSSDGKNSFERGVNDIWVKMSPEERYELLKSLLSGDSRFTEEQLKEFSEANDIDEIKDEASNGEVIGRLMAAYNHQAGTLSAWEYQRVNRIPKERAV